jgi:multidrug efflux pump subunit AcrA (membrane-fusion protein)
MLDKSDRHFFPPIKSNEFLPPISRWTTWGGLMMVGTCSVTFLLAATIKFPIAVKASATVRPTGELRLVQANTTGTIESILKGENQFVKKGQAIAFIDNSQLKLQSNQLQKNIEQSKLLVTQINAQLKVLNAQILAESRSIERIVASARANLSINQRDYRDRQVITKTEMQEASANLELAKEEMKRYRQLANTGTIGKLQVKEKEQALKASLAKVERAKTGLNPIPASVVIANERIEEEKAKGEANLAILSKERENLIQRKVEIENQISRNANQLQQTEVALNKSLIRASTDGRILQLKLRNPGQFVNAGDAIAQIAPSNASLLTECCENSPSF